MPSKNVPRCWTVVLPLELEDGTIIPLPLILDTGAPGTLYLGSILILVEQDGSN